MTVPRPRLRVVLLAAAGDLAVWLVAALFATSEFYRRSIVLGGGVGTGVDWNDVLVVQLVTALNWAVFTPFVIAIAQEIPLRPPNRIRHLAAIAGLIPYLAVVRALMGGAVLNLGEGDPISRHMLELSVAIRTHPYAATVAVIFFVYNMVDMQREAAERARRRVREQTLLARLELDDLRMRLQPQFALRMLRHIGGVMREEPKAADALIVTLSGILRRSMARGVDERIRLADELEHFDRCLDLCRAGGRFAVAARYVADDDVLARSVPALILEPVLETVVLDLTSGSGGSVDIDCRCDAGETRIAVGWTVAPGGAARSTTVRIPAKEAA